MTRNTGPHADSVAYRLLAALAAAPDGILTNAQLLPLLQRMCWSRGTWRGIWKTACKFRPRVARICRRKRVLPNGVAVDD